MLAISQLLYEPPPKKDSSSGFFSVEKGYNTPVPGGHADPFSHRAQSGPGPGPHLLTLDFFFFYSQAQASSVVGFHLTQAETKTFWIVSEFIFMIFFPPGSKNNTYDVNDVRDVLWKFILNVNFGPCPQHWTNQKSNITSYALKLHDYVGTHGGNGCHKTFRVLRISTYSA